MNETIVSLRKELQHMADPKLEESGKRFFKETVKMYGTKTADVLRVAKRFFKEVQDEPKEDIYSLCTDLWKSGMMEESFIACEWSASIHKRYEPCDFKVFETWVNAYVTNWASCDTLCNHTVGSFLMKFPQYSKELKRWAKSKNMWMRRASAVSFIIPARKGMFLKDIEEIADILLLDREDLVQKGYGWALKAASQFDQKRVFQFVMERKSAMPRTALRYAIEKMPIELKKQAMQK